MRADPKKDREISPRLYLVRCPAGTKSSSPITRASEVSPSQAWLSTLTVYIVTGLTDWRPLSRSAAAVSLPGALAGASRARAYDNRRRELQAFGLGGTWNFSLRARLARLAESVSLTN